MILGQDPYHNNGQAHGLCFSVKKGVEIPPSLVNIYQELHDDLGCTIPDHGCLTKWAEQGVLMLNTVLTVRAHQAKFPPGDRVGRVYGCRDHGAQQPGPSHRIYSVGQSGAEKESHA